MGDASSIDRMGGSPAFETPGRDRRLEVSVGDEFQASMSVGNRGGGAEGLRVVVGGEAVEEERITVETIGLRGGEGQERLEVSADRQERADGGRIFVATFPEATVAGALAGDVDLSEMSDRRGQEVMRAHRASRVSVSVSGRAEGPGDGGLAIELSAMDAPEASTTERSHITVFPTPRRPLHAEEEPPPHTLRQMEKKETLFALAHFDAPVGDWAESATEAIAAWSDIIAEEEATLTRVESTGAGRPTEDEVSAAVLGHAGELEALQDRLGDLDQWSVVLKEGAMRDGRLDPGRTGGVSYFACTGRVAGGGEPAPALGFWVSVADRAGDEVDELRDALTGIVDDLAETGHLVQAVSDQWSWAPALKIQSLPYEIVCGLQSAGHLRRDWLGRYLRAAADDLWLGDVLWERIDADAVEDVGEVETIDGVHHVRLTRSADLDALEEVLAPVLADEEAWREEKEQLSG